MAAHLGAHETIEIHEVLTNQINAINHFQLYRGYVQDQMLLQILDRQLQFTASEYNNMVNLLHQQGGSAAVPYRYAGNTAPTYGLDHPAPQAPNASVQLDDRSVAGSMLSCHKCSAHLKMLAALECADPQLRRMMQQGAVNCSEQAYEVWQYMNQKGYYQVPTMKEMTTNTVLNSFQPAPALNLSAQANRIPFQIQP